MDQTKKDKITVRFSDADTHEMRELLNNLDPNAGAEIKGALERYYISMLYEQIQETLNDPNADDANRRWAIGEKTALDQQQQQPFTETDERRLDLVCSYYCMLLWQILWAKKERGEPPVFNPDVAKLDSPDIVERAGADMALLTGALDIGDPRSKANMALFSCRRSIYNNIPKDNDGYSTFEIDDIRGKFTQGTLFDVPAKKPKAQTWTVDATGETGLLPATTRGNDSQLLIVDRVFINGIKATPKDNGFFKDAKINVQKGVNVTVSMNYNGDVKNIRDIDETDYRIIEAIANAYLGNGPRVKIDAKQHAYVTSEQIYNSVKNRDKGKVRPEQEQDIIARMDRLTKTDIYIDYAQQYHALNPKDKATGGKDLTFAGQMIHADKVTISANGTTKTGWIIMDEPRLSQYAKMTQRIMSVPHELLVNCASVAESDKKAIQGYHTPNIQHVLFELAHKAGQMAMVKKRKAGKPSATIRLYKLIENAGYQMNGNEPADRHAGFCEKIIETVQRICDEMERGGAITGYGITDKDALAKSKKREMTKREYYENCKITIFMDSKKA